MRQRPAQEAPLAIDQRVEEPVARHTSQVLHSRREKLRVPSIVAVACWVDPGRAHGGGAAPGHARKRFTERACVTRLADRSIADLTAGRDARADLADLKEKTGRIEGHPRFAGAVLAPHRYAVVEIGARLASLCIRRANTARGGDAR
jgi:hypothetical protein